MNIGALSNAGAWQVTTGANVHVRAVGNFTLMLRKKLTNVAALSGSVTGNSAAYTNFIARTSGLNTTHQNAYAALLNGLTTDGFFQRDLVSLRSLMLCMFFSSTSPTVLLNLVKNSFNLTANNSMTLTPDSGYVSGGTFVADYLETGFNPATAGE